MPGSQIEGIGVSPRGKINLNRIATNNTFGFFFFSLLLRNLSSKQLSTVKEAARRSALCKISRQSLLGVGVDWEASWEGGGKDVGGGGEEGGNKEEDDQVELERHHCAVTALNQPGWLVVALFVSEHEG